MGEDDSIGFHEGILFEGVDKILAEETFIGVGDTVIVIFAGRIMIEIFKRVKLIFRSVQTLQTHIFILYLLNRVHPQSIHFRFIKFTPNHQKLWLLYNTSCCYGIISIVILLCAFY